MIYDGNDDDGDDGGGDGGGGDVDNVEGHHLDNHHNDLTVSSSLGGRAVCFPFKVSIRCNNSSTW